MPRGPALAVKPVQIETFVGSVEPVFSQRARFGRLASSEENRESRYVSDLKRFGYGQSLFFGLRKTIVPLGLSVVFLAVVGTSVAGYKITISGDWLTVAIAAVVDCYMALHIGERGRAPGREQVGQDV